MSSNPLHTGKRVPMGLLRYSEIESGYYFGEIIVDKWIYHDVSRYFYTMLGPKVYRLYWLLDNNGVHHPIIRKKINRCITYVYLKDLAADVWIFEVKR